MKPHICVKKSIRIRKRKESIKHVYMLCVECIIFLLSAVNNRKRGLEQGYSECIKVPRLVGMHTVVCKIIHFIPIVYNKISESPLLKFRPKLADFYSKQPEVPEGTWPPVKMRHYINLALIKQKAIDFSKDYVRQTIHGSMDDVIKDKDEITYEDAFIDLEDGALVILEGRPGCGKTTLMHKLSQDWEKCSVLASRLYSPYRQHARYLSVLRLICC